MTSKLTAARLRELLHYDPETGVFTRLVTVSSRARKGDVAGAKHSAGYLHISIDYERLLCHRLAWLYMTGEWPRQEIDHRDGVGDNNRWSNLRDVPHETNMQNQLKARSDNRTTGTLGVFESKERGFVAQISIKGRTTLIGSYATQDEAQAAYLAAKRSLHAGCTL